MAVHFQEPGKDKKEHTVLAKYNAISATEYDSLPSDFPMKNKIGIPTSPECGKRAKNYPPIGSRCHAVTIGER